jgi:3-methyladenine DNA glycosylase/8-oxoguanine DNA glycosylase
MTTHNQIFEFDTEDALAHLSDSSVRMARLIERIGPFLMEVRPTPSVFAALAQAVVYQQLHGKAAATIFERLCQLFPRPSGGPTAAGLMKLDDAVLRGAGLSNNKMLALRDLATKSLARQIPTITQAAKLDNETLIEQLTVVRGIGRWTVEMLLMFRLGRPDVLPVDDFGIRKGYAVTFAKKEMPAPRDLARYGERWAPYRTVASWYLWRAADIG